MNVLYLTIFISLLLAVIFIVCFVSEAWRTKGGDCDRAALLPLLDSEPTETKPSPNKHNKD